MVRDLLQFSSVCHDYASATSTRKRGIVLELSAFPRGIHSLLQVERNPSVGTVRANAARNPSVAIQVCLSYFSDIQVMKELLKHNRLSPPLSDVAYHRKQPPSRAARFSCGEPGTDRHMRTACSGQTTDRGLQEPTGCSLSGPQTFATFFFILAKLGHFGASPEKGN
jgi:hypothetical protein